MNKQKISVSFSGMKQVLAMCFFVLSVCVVQGQAVGDYGSTGNTNWTGGSWQVCISAGTWFGASSTTTPPTALSNVWILAGHTVTLTSSVSCANLYLSGTITDGGYEVKATGNVIGNGAIQGSGRLNVSFVTSQILPTITTGSSTITLANASSLIVKGQLVTGKGIKTGTTVSSVSGTAVTLSNATTASNSNVTVFFSNPTHVVSLNGGGLTVSNLMKSSAGTLNLSGNLNILGDLSLTPSIAATSSGTAIQDSGYNINVGGNLFNLSGNRADVRGAATEGWLVLTGLSTSSGVISLGTISAGNTSGYAVGDTLSITGGSSAIPALAVVSAVTSGAVSNISLIDVGTSYTNAPTGFTAKSGKGTGAGVLTNSIVANTQSVKYLATGFYYVRKLSLASTVADNTLIQNTGSTLQVMDTIQFTPDNTTGSYTLSTNVGLYLGGALWNTNIATAGALIMAPTNYIRGGTSLSNAVGSVVFTSYSTQAPIYFDPNANFISKLQQLGENSGKFHLGNSVVVKDLVSAKGGSIIVDSSATLSIPSTVTSVNGVNNGKTTGVFGSINATAKGAKVILYGSSTLPSGLFSPPTISNLAVTNKALITLKQSATIVDSLFLESSSTLKIDTAYTATISGNTAGTGLLDASLGSVVMNGTSAQTINMPSAGNLTINNAAGVTASPAVSGLLTITNGDLSDYSNISSSTSVLYNGTAAQTANAGLSSINNLTIDNASGVTLVSSPTINGALTLTSGKLLITDKTLKLGAASTISQASAANNYIVIGGTATVKRTVAAGAATLFPVGTSTTYNPVTLTPTSATDLYVSVVTGNTPALNTIGGTLDITKTLNRTWNITPTVPSATDITIGYDGVADANSGFVNTGSEVALLHNAGTWEYAQHVLPGSGVGVSKSATFTGITSFSGFGIANPGAGAVYINNPVAKANDEYRSVASGNWDDASTWQVLNASTLNWESTVTIPNETNTATIRAGHTVTLNSQAGIGTLTIEKGATLKSANNAYTAASIVFTIGKSNSVINNNGTFGAAVGSANTTGGDGISINIAPACTSFSLTGTGITGIGSLYPLAGSKNLVAIIDQDVQFRASSAFSKKTVLSLVDPKDVTSTGSRTFILNAGKTISFIDSNACLHSASFNNKKGVFTAQQGDISYDIQGTLDLNGGNIYLSSSNNAASSTQKVKLNIGAAAKVIVSGDFNVYKSQSSQSVYTYVEEGGLIDASGAITGANDFGLSRNAIATASLANVNNNATVNVSAANGGYYTSVPTVTVSGISSGAGLTATAVLTGTAVTSIVFSGSNGAYTGTPILSISPSTVGDLSWVVMGGINAAYKRYVTNSGEVFNVAVPTATGNYSSIKGNPVKIMFQPSFANDVYTVGITKGITPALVNFSKDYAINRVWKVQPTNLRSGFDFSTFISFGFTGGSEDANTNFSPTYPAFTYGTSSPELNNGYSVPNGNMDLLLYRDFTKTWVQNGGYFNTNQPSVSNFGTTWQVPTQLGSNSFPPGFMINNFFPPYLFTIKNTAAPYICP